MWRRTPTRDTVMLTVVLFSGCDATHDACDLATTSADDTRCSATVKFCTTWYLNIFGPKMTSGDQHFLDVVSEKQT
jgi:hypothetical protein